MNKVELLAPCGSFEALKAAVATGADAVYLGGSGFGARAFAKNFDYEEMVEAIKFAHVYGVSVYVTLNTIIYDHEMNDVLNYVKFLYENDVDAVIVQDLGLMSQIKKQFPDLEVHASTQMTIHNLEGVKFLKNLGIERVVLARENTIEQISKIIKDTGIDTEVFVHGALCVCYSGQCLMSGLIGGRSGNRGKCAQPCRKKYSLKVNQETVTRKQYLISPKDLNNIENIDKIIESGIKSLKIEGRMKSPEYVSIVVSAYRKAIDQYYEHKRVLISDEVKNDITQIFNRKFTHGFLFGAKGETFINLDKNNNTGVLIGKVISSENNKVKVKISKNLNLNDGIYFENTDIGMTVSRIIMNNKEIKQANTNDIVVLDVPSQISKNTDVYKTTDVLLEEKAKILSHNLQIIPIHVEIELFRGSRPKITIQDFIGNCITKEIDFTIEESKKQSLDDEKIKEQISKLGNTPFYLKDIKIKKDQNIFITMGALNNLRREAVDALILARQTKYNRTPKHFKYEFLNTNITSINHAYRLSVYVRTIDQLKAALNHHIDIIYIDEELKAEINSNEGLYLAKGRIEFNPKIDNRFKGYLISHLGSLNLIKNSDLDRKVISNYNMNIVNSESIQFLLNQGVDLVTLSYEFNENSYKNLLFEDKSKLEVIIYGYQEAMITKHCIYASNCKEQCKENSHKIADDRNEMFNLYFDDLCHMHILNSKKLVLFDEVKRLMEFNYTNFRLQFTIENYDEASDVIDAYKKFIFNNDVKSLKLLQSDYKDKNNFTRGYFNKEY